MTYTAELDQIKAMLDGNGLDGTPADAIETGDVRYQEDNNGIAIQLAVDEDFTTEDLENILDQAYQSTARDRHGSKRYTIRNAGLNDPRGFYVDDILGGFTTRVETEEERQYIRLDFGDYRPDEAIDEAYTMARTLED